MKNIGKREKRTAVVFFIFIMMSCLVFALSGSAESAAHVWIEEEAGDLVLHTEHVRVTIMRNGAVSEILHKEKNLNYGAAGSYAAFLTASSGGAVTPVGMSFEQESDHGGEMTLLFSDRFTVSFRVTVYDDYILFKLTDGQQIPDDYSSITILPVNFSQRYLDDPDFMAYYYVLNCNTLVSYYPGQKVGRLFATAYPRLDTAGAGVAFIACPEGRYRDVLRDLNDHIVDPEEMITTGRGGAHANDHEGNFGDYVIISTSAAADVPVWKTFYVQQSVDQLDFHQGGGTFRQGDFYFYQYGGLASGFKSSVSDELKKVGITSGLHTYSFYINPGCTAILSNPVYQQQLDYNETFTLSQAMTASGTQMYVVESIAHVPLGTNFFTTNSLYLLVDQEIIKYTSTAGGYFTVTRGLCGTAPAAHGIGAQVHHIVNVFFLFAPRPDTELFRQIALNTARAYVEGGFDMIYLDALDGISRHVTGSDAWYYVAQFVKDMLNEIYRLGGSSPLLEYSTMYPSLWYGRSRDGAWDHGTKGYRKFVESHLVANEASVLNRYLSTQLGWYHFYPAPTGDYYGGFQIKYHSAEETHYTGTKMLAYDNGIAFNGLTPAVLTAYPAYARNLSIMVNYQTLRKTKYFSERIKEQLRDYGKDFELVQVSAGVWKFYEKQYQYHKFHTIAAGLNSFVGSNPYAPQQPFIRIEGLFSSGVPTTGPNAFLLFDFDPEASISSQMTSGGTYMSKNMFDETILVDAPGTDLSGKIAIKTRVYGNGMGGAVMIRLTGIQAETGYADRVIPIDFTGWREFTLVEVDNGFYDYTFAGASTSGYSYLRASAYMQNIRQAGVYTSGDMSGVRIDDIYCVPFEANSYQNPKLTINGRSITFHTTLDYSLSGGHYGVKYIEYTPGQPKAKMYDEYGNYTEVTYTLSDPANGMLVPGGAYTAAFTASSYTVSPGRILVTLGFTGNEVLDKLFVKTGETAHGAVSTNAAGGVEDGDTVVVTVLPEEGYKLKADGLSIHYSVAGKACTEKIYMDQNGSYRFVMPDANVRLDAEFVESDRINFSMIGAGIRIPGVHTVQGLRFLARYQMDANGIDVIETGVVVIPTRLLKGELNLYTVNALVIKRSEGLYYSATPYYFEYTGVIVNIPEYEYKTGITARAYLKYAKTGRDGVFVRYTDAIERSVYGVAVAAILDDGVTEADKIKLSTTLDRYLDIPKGDNVKQWSWFAHNETVEIGDNDAAWSWNLELPMGDNDGNWPWNGEDDGGEDPSVPQGDNEGGWNWVLDPEPGDDDGNWEWDRNKTVNDDLVQWQW